MPNTSQTAVRGPRPLAQTKKGMPNDERITCCTNCKRGIFKGREKVWTSNGFIHPECV